jgi:hypothetical protein
MERILCRIEYISKENPTCNILINGKKQCDFIGDSTFFEFRFEVDTKNFTFTIEHFGKDMKRETNKFIEIKKIYFNDIDIKDMIWKTVQIPKLPKWQKHNDFIWEGNLFLGHNSSISYDLQSPITDFLFDYHQPTSQKQKNILVQNNEYLNEVKNYFLDIVEKQNTKNN